jgi:3-isopropylmalate dehydrogenase
MNWTIAVIPGDGIGPEIIEEAILVLIKIGSRFGHAFSFIKLYAGGCAIDTLGMPLPQETIEACKKSDSVLLGSVGGPKWDGLEIDERPEKALLGLRKELGLFANIRPAVLHDILKNASPLRDEIIAGGVDVCIVRELTGGIYFGPREKRISETGEEAYDTEIYHENEIRRIAKIAFRFARKRRKKVTSVDKANVLESSKLWRAVVTDEASFYPDIQLEHMYVDNAAMQLVRNPRQFDVILTTNMFGDILSDEASMITGSIGMQPSASLGAKREGMYEPIHGSAPDIAGQDRANPIAAILSTAMMLRYSLELENEAAAVEQAVHKVLARDYRTADIMSQDMKLVGTREMGRLIVEAID